MLQIETANALNIDDGINIHEYRGKDKRVERAFWSVDKLTNFENVSVSRAVQLGNGSETNMVIERLRGAIDCGDAGDLQLRYLMCSGPPMDLSALFSPNASNEQKQNIQKMLNTPQICEKVCIR